MDFVTNFTKNDKSLDITFFIVFANFINEALNGGQVQLPKFSTIGMLDLQRSFKFIFDLESKSIKSMLPGTSSPLLT